MNASRRTMLWAGGSFLAGLATPVQARSGPVVEILMQGNAQGSDVWFDPIGIHVEPGQTIRWINRDPGNAHTATAYHPQNFDRARRIPEGAASWDSDYLLPGESFSIVLKVEGVYDYYCIPHEHAGMVGRIIVGRAGTPGAIMSSADDAAPIPSIALQNFPSVEEILGKGVVRPG